MLNEYGSYVFSLTIELDTKCSVSFFLCNFGAATYELRQVDVPIPPVNGFSTVDLEPRFPIRH